MGTVLLLLQSIRKMNLESLDLGVDENCVMLYLNNFPGEFINEREIARRADRKERFSEDPHWAHNALVQLTEMKLLETDGGGRYRQSSEPASRPAKAAGPGAKFMDPKLRAILEHSSHKFDLSRYG